MFSNIKYFYFLLTTFLFLFFPQNALAQVVLNEISPASEPEWVEIYNIGLEEASLKDYLINFGSDTQNKSFCDNDKIAAGGYKLIILTSNWLSNNGDVVTLKKGDDEVDKIGYGTGYPLGKPTNTGSITRSPDGTGGWIVTTTQTQQGDTASFECPTASPTQPPATQQPTIQPTQVPTASPTVKPTPTKSPTPKPTSTPTQEAEETDAPENKVTSLFGQVVEATPTGLVAGANTTNKSTFFAITLISLGIIFLGYGGYLLYNRKTNNNDNSKSEETN